MKSINSFPNSRRLLFYMAFAAILLQGCRKEGFNFKETKNPAIRGESLTEGLSSYRVIMNRNGNATIILTLSTGRELTDDDVAGGNVAAFLAIIKNGGSYVNGRFELSETLQK